ncbi:hypothetical protein FQN57_005249 [Myotisia sp. PD_48]|nr:hypothetical protein FQN57_005249 [Myotisia sp. PD_48]
MAPDNHRAEELLKRPLYVYNLPTELLNSLTTKSSGSRTPLTLEQAEPHKAETEGDEDSGTLGSTSCTLCQVFAKDVEDHRQHVKSDHHRYNIKARLRGTTALNEIDFNKAIGDLDESISGSDSETEDDDENDQQRKPDDTLTTLLKRQAKISSQTNLEQALMDERPSSHKQPLVWFTSPSLPQNTSLGVWRALFTRAEQDELSHIVDSLKKKQVQPITAGGKSSDEVAPPVPVQNVPHVFLCMIGGGHFAAMIVALAPEMHKGEGGVDERRARVLAHKTFHRYTTRRKQGGAQSANDAAKGAAHSAGSTLRRYNEAALETEIRHLLRDWKAMIDESQLLFIRATGTTNRRILFGPYEGQVLKRSDPRIRSFPFSTRRATQAELMRGFTELTRVKVSRIDEEALAAEEAKRVDTASKSPQPPRSQQQKPKISKDDEAAMLHTSQIQALIRRSKAPALLSYLSTNSIPPDFRFYPENSSQNYHSSTPLHLAASSNSPAIVNALLLKAKADPGQLNDDGKPPFDLIGDRITRDAFRVARHELGEEAWDWDAAHVPAGISREQATSRQEEEKKAADNAELKRRKEERERLKTEVLPVLSSRGQSAGRTLASLPKTGAEKREEESRGMTPEMRMRLERERRARAAEERFRKIQDASKP